MSPAPNRFLALLKQSRTAPVVIAHRGDSFHAPENTLEAARLARQAGADAWELDVQLTRDGIPVVLHDESLFRTTDVDTRFPNDARCRTGFKVCDFDLDEVQSLDAGSWFVDQRGGPRTARAFGSFDRLDEARIAHYRSGQVSVPTLADALILTKELDWLVNVEIKSFPSHPPVSLERVLEVVAATDTASRVLISSFDHTDLAAANRRDRHYALGMLTSIPLYRIHDYVTDFVGADTVHFSAEVLGSESIAYRREPAGRRLRTDLVAELQRRQIPVLVYTVNDFGPGSLTDEMANIGVDGLFSDNPNGTMRHFAATSGRPH